MVPQNPLCSSISSLTVVITTHCKSSVDFVTVRYKTHTHTSRRTDAKQRQSCVASPGCLRVMYDLHFPPRGPSPAQHQPRDRQRKWTWGNLSPVLALFLPGELQINTFIKVPGWDLHLLPGESAELGLWVMRFAKSSNWNESCRLAN